MKTIVLLTISNVFMNLAWYGHLKFKDQPLWLVILAGWGIAQRERDPVMLPIPGTSKVKHLEENTAAALIDLDDSTVTELERLAGE